MKNYIDVQYEQCAQLSIFDLPERVITLTGEINGYKDVVASSIWEIGKRLCEAKELLEHGQWLPWLKEFVEISERTAQRFMSLYKAYPKSDTVTDLGAKKALILKALEPEDRDEFMTENDVAGMTSEELKQALAERDAARAEVSELKQDFEEWKDALEKASREKKELEAQKDASAEANAQAMKEYQDEAFRLAEELEKLRTQKTEAEEKLEKAKADKKDAVDKYKALKDNPDIPPEVMEKLRADVEAAAKAEAEAAAEARVKETDGKLAETEKALATRQAEVDELQKKLALADPTAKEFQVYFGEFQGYYNRLTGLLVKLEEEKRERFRGALVKLLGGMAEGLADGQE